MENFSEGMQRFRCICKADFTGIFCHIKVNRKKVNACTYNSCLNSGETFFKRDSFNFSVSNNALMSRLKASAFQTTIRSLVFVLPTLLGDTVR